MRMSRIAQQNIDKVREYSHYGDGVNSREVSEPSSHRSARRGGGSGSGRGRAKSRGIGEGLGGVDTEVDFDDSRSPSTPTSMLKVLSKTPSALSLDADATSLPSTTV